MILGDPTSYGQCYQMPCSLIKDFGVKESYAPRYSQSAPVLHDSFLYVFNPWLKLNWELC